MREPVRDFPHVARGVGGSLRFDVSVAVSRAELLWIDRLASQVTGGTGNPLRSRMIIWNWFASENPIVVISLINASKNTTSNGRRILRFL